MAESGDKQERPRGERDVAPKEEGVLDLRTAHAAELAAEDVPPRRVDALWPETAVAPPKSAEAVTDPDQKTDQSAV